MDNSMEITYKKPLKVELPYDAAIPLDSYLEKMKTLNLERYIHPSVYSSFICNIQDMEATSSVHSSVCVYIYIYTYTYIYIYMHIHTHICICNGISLSHKKERNNAICSKWMDVEIIIPREVSQTKINII